MTPTPNIEKALVYQVLHDSGFAALAPTRFYPIAIPQTATFPLAVFQLITGLSTNVHKEVSILPRPIIQITCWGITFDSVVALDQAIKKAIDGKRGNWGTGDYVTKIESCVENSTPRDDRDSVTGLYQRNHDYAVMWLE